MFAALIPAALKLFQDQQKQNAANTPRPLNVGSMGSNQQQQQQLPTDFISSILKGFRNKGGSGISGGDQQSVGQDGSLEQGVEQQVGGPGIQQQVGSALSAQSQPTLLEQIVGDHLQQRQQPQQFDISQLMGNGNGYSNGSLF